MDGLKQPVAEKGGWFIALGIALIILGIISIAFPLFMTITAKMFLGWMILIGGIASVVHAFYARDWSGFFWNLLIGILYVIVGGWLAFFPLAGLIGLTVLIAFMFIGEGLVKAFIGFGMEKEDGRLWVIISGIAAIVVGIMLFSGMPSTAMWAIGTLVGINFLFSGWAFIMIATAAKSD
jgi:uncharacterized membrane protein HdeD (DUF308 family)